MSESHPVSFVIHIEGLSLLSLQPCYFLLELISLMFSLYSLILYGQKHCIRVTSFKLKDSE